MKQFTALLCRMLGPLLVIAGAMAAITLWASPASWSRILEENGVQSPMLLGLPLWAAVAIVALGCAMLVVGMADGMANKPLSESTSHGSARFSTTAEVRAKGFRTSGVTLGMEDSAAWSFSISPDDRIVWKLEREAAVVATRWLHVLVEGPNGSGKDEGIVLPTLNTDVERAFVVLDPKGAAYKRSAGYRSAYQVVFRFAPCEESSARFNPLCEVPIGTPREAIEAERIAGVLVGSAAKEEMSSRIYLKSCELLLTCAILHVLHRCPEAERTLPGVLRFLTDPKFDEAEIAAAMYKAPPPSARMACDSLRRLAADKRMLQGAFTTVLDVLGFCRMPLVADAISGSDFVSKDLSQKPTPATLYLIIPFRDAEILRPLARLMLNCILSHHTEERTHETVYMLNELPSLGNIPAIPRGLAELREYGVQLVLFVQSEAQLFSVYGKEDATTIIDNCRARVTLGVSGQYAAKSASERLGKATIVRPRSTQAVSKRSMFDTTVTKTAGEGEQARELMTPDEVRAQSADCIFIDLPELRTYKAKRLIRYAMPELLRRSEIPAPTPKRAAKLRRVV